MERLKELGTWIILVIAFYLFSNGIIYICLQQSGVSKTNETAPQMLNHAKK